MSRAHAGLGPLGYSNGTKGNGYAPMVQVASASRCVWNRLLACASSTRRLLWEGFSSARGQYFGAGVCARADCLIWITNTFACSTWRPFHGSARSSRGCV